MSGSDSNSSDNEFWNSFEKVNLCEKEERKTLAQTSNFAALRMSEKERYEKTILNIRDSKEEELQNLKIKMINSSKKEINLRIGRIKEEFLKEKEKLNETFANSRKIVQKKDKKIADLSETVIEQENLISKFRILSKKTKELRHTPKSPEKVEDSPVKEQLKLLFELCDQYKSDVDRYKALNEKLLNENHQLKKNYEEIVKRMENYSSEILETLKLEKSEIENEFARYRLESEKEVEVRELINNRQLQLIKQLQDELKLAKMVIKSPRLHNKALDRVKDSNAGRDERNQDSQEKLKEKTIVKPFYKVAAKLPSAYTYKEYKVFDGENAKQEWAGLRSLTQHSRPELTSQKSSNLSYYLDSRKKLKKDSVLYYKEPLFS